MTVLTSIQKSDSSVPDCLTYFYVMVVFFLSHDFFFIIKLIYGLYNIIIFFTIYNVLFVLFL